MNKRIWTTTILVEVVGIIVVSSGIGLELAMRADWGFAIISVGSLFIAAGGAIYAKFLRHS